MVEARICQADTCQKLELRLGWGTQVEVWHMGGWVGGVLEWVGRALEWVGSVLEWGNEYYT